MRKLGIWRGHSSPEARILKSPKKKGRVRGLASFEKNALCGAYVNQQGKEDGGVRVGKGTLGSRRKFSREKKNA